MPTDLSDNTFYKRIKHMKMVNVSKDVLNRANKNYAPSKVQRFIAEFIASGKDIIEVEFEKDEYNSPYSCTGSMKEAIKSMNVSDSVKAVTVDHHSYLYREGLI